MGLSIPARLNVSIAAMKQEAVDNREVVPESDKAETYITVIPHGLLRMRNSYWFSIITKAGG